MVKYKSQSGGSAGGGLFLVIEPPVPGPGAPPQPPTHYVPEAATRQDSAQVLNKT